MKWRFETSTGWYSLSNYGHSFCVLGWLSYSECARCRERDDAFAASPVGTKWEPGTHNPLMKVRQFGVVLFNRYFGFTR